MRGAPAFAFALNVVGISAGGSGGSSGQDVVALFSREHSACREPFEKVESLFRANKERLRSFGHPVDFKEEVGSSAQLGCSIVFFAGEKPDYTCLLPPPSWGNSMFQLDERYVAVPACKHSQLLFIHFHLFCPH